jgi:CheY-like chemotaxis protein
MAKPRLLVCDDEEALGRFVRNVTEPLGYEVRLATSGEELIACYDAFAPTVILLDMVMPDMDGNEVILWLAEQGYAARLIIMTGYHPQYADHARILADFRGIGSVATLRKPFGIDELIATLAPPP